jgi:hypothetical protein
VRRQARRRSEADPGGQPLPVIAAVTEEQLAGLGPLEVQVRVMFQVKPMPPWIWMFSPATREYTSEA